MMIPSRWITDDFLAKAILISLVIAGLTTAVGHRIYHRLDYDTSLFASFFLLSMTCLLIAVVNVRDDGQ